MIFFTDKNSPTYKALGKFRATSARYSSSDEERLEYVNRFLDWYWEEYHHVPDGMVIETLSSFLVKPYTGVKSMEYPILSVYGLENKRRNEVKYNDLLAS